MALELRYTGGISNPAADRSLITESRGGTVTILALLTGLLNLFDNVSGAETTAGDTEYRAVDIYANAVALSSMAMYISSQPTNTDVTLEIAWEHQLGYKNYTAITKTAAENTVPAVANFTSLKDIKGFSYDGKTGSTIAQGAAVQWSGGTGKVYHISDADSWMEIELSTGAWPTNDVEIADGSGSAANTVDVNGTLAYTARAFAAFATGSRLDLPNLSASGAHRIWLKRIVGVSSASMANDTTEITIEYIAA